MKVGLDDLNGLFQPMILLFSDSMIKCFVGWARTGNVRDMETLRWLGRVSCGEALAGLVCGGTFKKRCVTAFEK